MDERRREPVSLFLYDFRRCAELGRGSADT